MKRIPALTALTALVALWTMTLFAAVPQLINFQGILKDGSGNPVANGSYSVTFTIYDAASSGNNLWTETQSVSTSNGLFAVLLGSTNPIPDTAFKGTGRWLGIAVSPDPEMPRQQLVSVSYAYRVNSVDSASGGTIISKVSIGPGHTNTGINAFIAGENNTASGGAAAIGGGSGNTASGTNATVSGGTDNTAGNTDAAVGGGEGNTAGGYAAVVGGGEFNSANATDATIGGGQSNIANGDLATIGGGVGNIAGGTAAAVGGGQSDTASGLYATVPGGRRNKAAGNYSFGAGRRAKALHLGSFVWADSSVDADFFSTAANQFLIRASNVGIGLNNPSKKLEVAGSIKVGTSDTVFSSNISSNSPLTLQAPAGTTRIFINDANGNVGIGTTIPAGKLHIEDANFLSAPVRIKGLSGAAIGPTIEMDATDGTAGNSYSIISTNTGAGAGGGKFSLYHNGPTNTGYRLIIDSTGKVGLGTTTPQNRLDVEGGAAIGLGYSGTNAAPANGLLVEGNVGIGTTSAVNKLDVEGGAVIGAAYSGTNAAPANGLLVEGLVGIGTSSPNYPLHVAGDASFTGTFVKIGAGAVTASRLNVAGALATTVTAITATTTLTDAHSVVFCNNAAPITINLPFSSNACYRQYSIKRIGTGSVTIAAASNDFIDDAATYVLPAVNSSVIIASNCGFYWWILASH